MKISASIIDFDNINWFIAMNGDWIELDMNVMLTDKEIIEYQQPVGLPITTTFTTATATTITTDNYNQSGSWG